MRDSTKCAPPKVILPM